MVIGQSPFSSSQWAMDGHGSTWHGTFPSEITRTRGTNTWIKSWLGSSLRIEMGNNGIVMTQNLDYMLVAYILFGNYDDTI